MDCEMPHKDPEIAREYHRRWRQINKAKRAARRPLDDRVRHANQRALRYGAPGRITIYEVQVVLHVGARCHYCGKTALEVGGWGLGIDHVIPLHLGGPNEQSNIVACCQRCNISKHRSDRPWRWAREHDACIRCGGTDRPHAGNGYCSKCTYYVVRKGARIAKRERQRSLSTGRDVVHAPQGKET